jgi:hypothetical protein
MLGKIPKFLQQNFVDSQNKQSKIDKKKKERRSAIIVATTFCLHQHCTHFVQAY